MTDPVEALAAALRAYYVVDCVPAVRAALDARAILAALRASGFDVVPTEPLFTPDFGVAYAETPVPTGDVPPDWHDIHFPVVPTGDAGLDFAQLDAFSRLEEAIEGERRSWIRVEIAPDDLAMLLQFAQARLSSSDTGGPRIDRVKPIGWSQPDPRQSSEFQRGWRAAMKACDTPAEDWASSDTGGRG